MILLRPPELAHRLVRGVPNCVAFRVRALRSPVIVLVRDESSKLLNDGKEIPLVKLEKVLPMLVTAPEIRLPMFESALPDEIVLDNNVPTRFIAPGVIARAPVNSAVLSSIDNIPPLLAVCEYTVAVTGWPATTTGGWTTPAAINVS